MFWPFDSIFVNISETLSFVHSLARSAASIQFLSTHARTHTRTHHAHVAGVEHGVEAVVLLALPLAQALQLPLHHLVGHVRVRHQLFRGHA